MILETPVSSRTTDRQLSVEAANGLRVVWKLQSLNPHIASTRYRCLIPAKYLSDLHVASRVYSDADLVNLSRDVDCVVFVKSFSDKDITYAKYAHAHGIPIVLDLCDNIFHSSAAKNSAGFLQMAKLAAHIVVTGPELERAVREAVPSPLTITQIPDPVEAPTDAKYLREFPYREQIAHLRENGMVWLLLAIVPRVASLISRTGVQKGLSFINFLISRVAALYWALLTSAINWVDPKNLELQYLFEIKRLATALDKDAPILTTARGKASAVRVTANPPSILWFGNSGQRGLFGISDIELIAEPLAKLFAETPFVLTVVSNSKSMFDQLIAPLPFPSRYVEWSPSTLELELKNAKVAIMPNARNPFAACKSANRALLALSRGVPVVATSTPALKSLESCVIFDDWHLGLKEYLIHAERRTKHVEVAQRILEREFLPPKMAQRWHTVLRQVCARS